MPHTRKLSTVRNSTSCPTRFRSSLRSCGTNTYTMYTHIQFVKLQCLQITMHKTNHFASAQRRILSKDVCDHGWFCIDPLDSPHCCAIQQPFDDWLAWLGLFQFFPQCRPHLLMVLALRISTKYNRCRLAALSLMDQFLLLFLPFMPLSRKPFCMLLCTMYHISIL